MVRTCPDCALSLVPTDFHGVQVDACSNCGGIFFDEGEVSQIRQQGSSALELLDSQIVGQMAGGASRDAKLCPNCRVRMDEYRYLYTSPVVLNSCSHCGGIWAQDGELRQMAEHLKNEKESAIPPKLMVQMKAIEDADHQRARSVNMFMLSLIFGRHGRW
jgi:Zn-finger nucleic acid-binding protein